MEKNNQVLSSGQQKRLAKKKEAAAAKRKKKLTTIIVIVCLLAVAAAIIAAIVIGFSRKNTESATREDGTIDFSAGLAEDGRIAGVDAEDYVTKTVDYNNFSVPYSEIECTEEEIDEEIDSLLESYMDLDTTDEAVAKDGDTVDIDFVGSVDGVEFEGGNSNGEGYELKLGSHSFIDDFEEQVVGMAPGEVKTIEVTFPETYSKNPDLAGKDASFEVTFNGVYRKGEFNDEFVSKNLSDEASSADEYKQNFKNTTEDENLLKYIETKLQEESEVSDYPEDYLNIITELLSYTDRANYEYYNEMMYQYLGQYMYSSFEDYTGKTTEEYTAELQTRAQKQFALDAAVQYIADKAGITINDDDVAAYTAEIGENAVASYGQPYLMKCVMYEKVLSFLNMSAKIDK